MDRVGDYVTVVVLYCYLVLLFRFSFLFLRVCSRSCVRSPDCSILQRLIRYIPFSRCHFVCDYFFHPLVFALFFSFWSFLLVRISEPSRVNHMFLFALFAASNAYLYVARCVVLLCDSLTWISTGIDPL